MDTNEQFGSIGNNTGSESFDSRTESLNEGFSDSQNPSTDSLRQSALSSLRELKKRNVGVSTIGQYGIGGRSIDQIENDVKTSQDSSYLDQINTALDARLNTDAGKEKDFGDYDTAKAYRDNVVGKLLFVQNHNDDNDAGERLLGGASVNKMIDSLVAMDLYNGDSMRKLQYVDKYVTKLHDKKMDERSIGRAFVDSFVQGSVDVYANILKSMDVGKYYLGGDKEEFNFNMQNWSDLDREMNALREKKTSGLEDIHNISDFATYMAEMSGMLLPQFAFQYATAKLGSVIFGGMSKAMAAGETGLNMNAIGRAGLRLGNVSQKAAATTGYVIGAGTMNLADVSMQNWERSQEYGTEFSKFWNAMEAAGYTAVENALGMVPRQFRRQLAGSLSAQLPYSRNAFKNIVRGVGTALKDSIAEGGEEAVQQVVSRVSNFAQNGNFLLPGEKSVWTTGKDGEKYDFEETALGALINEFSGAFAGSLLTGGLGAYGEYRGAKRLVKSGDQFLLNNVPSQFENMNGEMINFDAVKNMEASQIGNLQRANGLFQARTNLENAIADVRAEQILADKADGKNAEAHKKNADLLIKQYEKDLAKVNEQISDINNEKVIGKAGVDFLKIFNENHGSLGTMTDAEFEKYKEAGDRSLIDNDTRGSSRGAFAQTIAEVPNKGSGFSVYYGTNMRAQVAQKKEDDGSVTFVYCLTQPGRKASDAHRVINTEQFGGDINKAREFMLNQIDRDVAFQNKAARFDNMLTSFIGGLNNRLVKASNGRDMSRKVYIYRDMSDLEAWHNDKKISDACFDNEAKNGKGNYAKGFTDRATGSVFINLSRAESLGDVANTFAHESTHSFIADKVNEALEKDDEELKKELGIDVIERALGKKFDFADEKILNEVRDLIQYRLFGLGDVKGEMTKLEQNIKNRDDLKQKVLDRIGDYDFKNITKAAVKRDEAIAEVAGAAGIDIGKGDKPSVLRTKFGKRFAEKYPRLTSALIRHSKEVLGVAPTTNEEIFDFLFRMTEGTEGEANGGAIEYGRYVKRPDPGEKTDTTAEERITGRPDSTKNRVYAEGSSGRTVAQPTEQRAEEQANKAEPASNATSEQPSKEEPAPAENAQQEQQQETDKPTEQAQQEPVDVGAAIDEMRRISDDLNKPNIRSRDREKAVARFGELRGIVDKSGTADEKAKAASIQYPRTSAAIAAERHDNAVDAAIEKARKSRVSASERAQEQVRKEQTKALRDDIRTRTDKLVALAKKLGFIKKGVKPSEDEVNEAIQRVLQVQRAVENGDVTFDIDLPARANDASSGLKRAATKAQRKGNKQGAAEVMSEAASIVDDAADASDVVVQATEGVTIAIQNISSDEEAANIIDSLTACSYARELKDAGLLYEENDIRPELGSDANVDNLTEKATDAPYFNNKQTNNEQQKGTENGQQSEERNTAENAGDAGEYRGGERGAGEGVLENGGVSGEQQGAAVQGREGSDEGNLDSSVVSEAANAGRLVAGDSGVRTGENASVENISEEWVSVKGGEPVLVRKVSPDSFLKSFRDAYDNLPNNTTVDMPSDSSAYEGGDCYLTADGMAGFVITKDRRLVSVFKNNDSHVRNFIDVVGAVINNHYKNENIILDCYSNIGSNNDTRKYYNPLEGIYAKAGFQTVARVEFNEDYATPEFIAMNGRPSVAFMVHIPDGVIIGDDVREFDKNGYDDAGNYAKSFRRSFKALSSMREGVERYNAVANGTAGAKKRRGRPSKNVSDKWSLNPIKQTDAKKLVKLQATQGNINVEDVVAHRINDILFNIKVGYHVTENVKELAALLTVSSKRGSRKVQNAIKSGNMESVHEMIKERLSDIEKTRVANHRQTKAVEDCIEKWSPVVSKTSTKYQEAVKTVHSEAEKLGVPVTTTTTDGKTVEREPIDIVREIEKERAAGRRNVRTNVAPTASVSNMETQKDSIAPVAQAGGFETGATRSEAVAVSSRTAADEVIDNEGRETYADSNGMTVQGVANELKNLGFKFGKSSNADKADNRKLFVSGKNGSSSITNEQKNRALAIFRFLEDNGVDVPRNIGISKDDMDAATFEQTQSTPNFSTEKIKKEIARLTSMVKSKSSSLDDDEKKSFNDIKGYVLDQLNEYEAAVKSGKGSVADIVDNINGTMGTMRDYAAESEFVSTAVGANARVKESAPASSEEKEDEEKESPKDKTKEEEPSKGKGRRRGSSLQGKKGRVKDTKKEKPNGKKAAAVKSVVESALSTETKNRKRRGETSTGSRDRLVSMANLSVLQQTDPLAYADLLATAPIAIDMRERGEDRVAIYEATKWWFDDDGVWLARVPMKIDVKDATNVATSILSNGYAKGMKIRDVLPSIANILDAYGLGDIVVRTAPGKLFDARTITKDGKREILVRGPRNGANIAGRIEEEQAAVEIALIAYEGITKAEDGAFSDLYDDAIDRIQSAMSKTDVAKIMKLVPKEERKKALGTDSTVAAEIVLATELTVLHEIEHCIQSVESRARGTDVTAEGYLTSSAAINAAHIGSSIVPKLRTILGNEAEYTSFVSTVKLIQKNYGNGHLDADLVKRVFDDEAAYENVTIDKDKAHAALDVFTKRYNKYIDMYGHSPLPNISLYLNTKGEINAMASAMLDVLESGDLRLDTMFTSVVSGAPGNPTSDTASAATVKDPRLYTANNRKYTSGITVYIDGNRAQDIESGKEASVASAISNAAAKANNDSHRYNGTKNEKSFIDSVKRHLKESGRSDIVKEYLNDSSKKHVVEFIPWRDNNIVTETTRVGKGRAVPAVLSEASYESVGSRDRIVTDRHLIDMWDDEIRRGEYYTTFRAMEYIDGVGLVPPMAGIIEGGRKNPKYNGPVNVGDYVRADMDIMSTYNKNKLKPGTVRISYFVQNEHTGKWKKQDTWVAPNPYIHSSFNPFNDQFTAAHNRPNMVVVRVLSPKSAVDGKRSVPVAKDPAGFIKWKAGPVATQLKNLGKPERLVLLSNYVKIDKILSPSETIDEFDELAGDVKDRLNIPYEVTTPALRKELVARGYNVVQESSGSRDRISGIDGVKYPVNSYGSKGVKNGDEVGWNYVSFRDDNITIDRKWVDGVLQSVPSYESADDFASSGSRDRMPERTAEYIEALKKANGLPSDVKFDTIRKYNVRFIEEDYELPKWEKHTDEAVLAKAKDIFLNDPNKREFILDAVFHASDNEGDATILSDVDKAVANLFNRQLNREFEAAVINRNNAKTTSEKAQADALLTKIAIIKKAFSDGITAIGHKTGQALRAQRFTIEGDLSYDGIVSDLVNKSRGNGTGISAEDLTDKDTNDIKNIAKKADELSEKRKSVTNEIDENVSKGEMAKAAKEARDEIKKQGKVRASETLTAIKNYAKTDAEVILGKPGMKGHEALENLRGIVIKIGKAIIRDDYLANPGKAMMPSAEFERELVSNVNDAIGEQCRIVGITLDPRTVRDMFSGYGYGVAEKRDDVQIRIGEMRSIETIVSEIEDLEKRNAIPLRKGAPRVEQSQELRELRRRLNIMLAKSGITNYDDNGELKPGSDMYKRTPLDIMIKRNLNRREDLLKALNTMTAMEKQKPTEMKMNKFAKELKEEIAYLTDQYNNMVARMTSYDDAVDYAVKSLNAEIERIESKIKAAEEGRYVKREKGPDVSDNPEVKRLKEVRKERLAELKKLRDTIDGVNIDLEKVKRAVKNHRESLDNERTKIERYTTKINDPNITKEEKEKLEREILPSKRNGYRTPKFSELETEYGKEWKKLQDIDNEREALQKDKNELVGDILIRHMGRVRKFFGYLNGIAQYSGKSVASYDLSSAGVQGSLAVLAHPIVGIKAVFGGLKSYWNIQYAKDRYKTLSKDPIMMRLMEAGMKFSDPSITDYNKSEERIATNAFTRRIEKILVDNLGPFGKFHAKMLKKSEFAFVTPLNELRYATAKSLVESIVYRNGYESMNKITDQEWILVANAVNEMSGASNWKHAAALREALGIWTPGKMASRIEYLRDFAQLATGMTGLGYESVTNPTRRAILLNAYARPAVGFICVAAVAALFNLLHDDDDDKDKETVVTDWRSAKMLKVRIGKHYISLVDDIGMYINLLGMTVTKQKKTGADIVKSLDEARTTLPSEVARRMWQNKLNPTAGLMWQLATGKDPTGKEIEPTVGNALKYTLSNMAIPIVLRDEWEMLTNKQEDILSKSILATIAICGYNGSDYGGPSYERERAVFTAAKSKMKYAGDAAKVQSKYASKMESGNHILSSINKYTKEKNSSMKPAFVADRLWKIDMQKDKFVALFNKEGSFEKNEKDKSKYLELAKKDISEREAARKRLME